MLSLFISLLLFAQPAEDDTTNIQSTIKSATVFLSGAEINRSASLTLQPGTNHIAVHGLSSSLREETIQLQSNSKITLQSIAKSLREVKEGDLSIELNQLELRREQVSDSIRQLEAKLRVLDKKINFLMINQDLNGENTKISAAEIRQAEDYFTEQFEKIENNRRKIEEQIKKLREEFEKVNQQINIINGNIRRASGVIELTVHSDNQQQAMFNISYFVPSARWKPTYDVRVAATDDPLDLIYKADISQNTGVDWENVNLTISSAQPRSDTSIPVIVPTYLQFYEPRPRPTAVRTQNRFDINSLETAGQSGVSQISGIVRDAQNGEPLTGVNILSVEEGNSTSTNRQGRYSLSVGSGAKLLRFSYIGYQPKEIPIRSSNMDISLQPSSMELNKTVVVGYGSGAQATLQEGQTAFSFKIENPYTIKSDSEPKTIAVKSYTLPAEYNYFSIPKRRKKALLTAKITDWSSLNLLRGQASLFLNDSYVGKTTIDPSAVDDTLSFSLGEDSDINIDRNQIESFQEKNFFGNKVTETKGWKIPVKNNKPGPVTIQVEDQIPVSTNEDIEIELQERSGANFDKSNGILTWEIKMKPGESKTLNFTYEVTYPTGKNLQELKKQ